MLTLKNVFLYRRRTDSTSAMYIKSSIPVQDKVPECNAYEALWNRHEQAESPNDLIIHIEGASGKIRTYQEFRTRVILAATALDKPLSAENAEMVAIISHSSSVRVRGYSAVKSYSLRLSGLCCTCPFPASSCDAVRFVRSMLDTLQI